MKKYLLLVLIALSLSSCGGPEEGPLGIHVGDIIRKSGDPRIYESKVTAIGKDWVEVTRHRLQRYSADGLSGVVIINCPHK